LSDKQGQGRAAREEGKKGRGGGHGKENDRARCKFK